MNIEDKVKPFKSLKKLFILTITVTVKRNFNKNRFKSNLVLLILYRIFELEYF